MHLEKLEEICNNLAGTTCDVKWGDDLCFLIGEKMYCVTGLEPPLVVSLKVTPEDFGELTTRIGIEPAAYLARYNWVSIKDPAALSLKEWEHYIRQSYQLVLRKLPRKLQKEILAKGGS